MKRDAANAMGFHDGENTKNVRDWKEVFDFLVKDGTLIPASHEPNDKELRVLCNQWPQYPPGFRYFPFLFKLFLVLNYIICTPNRFHILEI